MQSKILLKWPWFIAGVAGITFFLIFLMVIFFIGPLSRGFYMKPVPSASSQISPASLTGAGLPVRLKIPGINVNAALESVGLTLEGAVDVPKDPSNAAWFDLWPRPGENGSAVITGHYGQWKSGAGSVFDNLYKLRQGDKLYVEDDRGAIITFVVRASRSYDPEANAPEVFSSNDGKSHLNLITCEGAWNKVSKSYPKRLVVFTDKE